MKILAIIASPRKEGNTFLIVEKIADKLKSLGEIEVEYLFLSDVNLSFCRGCRICFKKGEDCCPNKEDGIKLIEEKMLSADGIILASPVYAMNMTALMKNLMDRLSFTMHRPRFFNQRALVVAVTRYSGLKETINSISQLKYTGLNIVQSLGLIAYNDDEPTLDKKTIDKIEKSAEKFYKKIGSKKPINPALESLVQFKVQQKMFSKFKKELYYDWEYSNSKNWLNPKTYYYVDNANINFGKNILAKLLAMCIK